MPYYIAIFSVKTGAMYYKYDFPSLAAAQRYLLHARYKMYQTDDPTLWTSEDYSKTAPTGYLARIKPQKGGNVANT